MQKTLILLTNSFPFGKSEPYLVTEINYLTQNFDRVIVFPLNKSGTLTINENEKIKIVDLGIDSIKSNISFTEYINILIEELPLLFKLPKPLYRIRYFRTYLLNKIKLAKSLVTILNIEQLSEKNNVTIYSYWFNDLAIISGFIKKQFPQVKTISRAHGFDLFNEQNLDGYIPFRKFQLKYTDIIYSVSKRGEMYLKENFPNQSSKIHTSYLGTLDNGITPLNDEISFSILTCSIIRNIKRLELMIDILNNIKDDLTWHVIGNGPEEDNLKQACKRLNENIKVIFHGYFSQQELFDFYKKTPINLLCSLSSSEGLPVSMMEAISFGIPIMSTDVGGCSEICNNKTGFLIKKNFNNADVANKIIEFRYSDKNASAFREGVRAYWEENFSANKNYPNFISNINLN